MVVPHESLVACWKRSLDCWLNSSNCLVIMLMVCCSMVIWASYVKYVKLVFERLEKAGVAFLWRGVGLLI